MSDDNDILFEITPQILLKAYACGIFPMSEAADDPGIFWVEPEMRGILPLNNFHIPKSLRKTLRKNIFEVRFDTQFRKVINACAETCASRQSTWINKQITELYCELHKQGNAHSVETWQDGELVGGLYGVKLGRAFFGESMFSNRTDASKVALVHLVEHLKTQGFILLDTQFTTTHLERFGVIEVPRDQYQELLHEAVQGNAIF